MEFLTLHELSVQLDTSVRVLRHRLRVLLTEGKLVENRDCRRDDYADPTHFVWRVDPNAFARATGLRSVTNSVNLQSLTGSSAANQVPRSDITPVVKPEQTLPKVDTKPSGMEREMIDLLKDQVRVKDVQIADLSEQNKSLNSLNLKLTGQIVQQSDRIQSLLRLTGGKTDFTEVVPKPANQSDDTATKSGSQPATGGTDFGNTSTDFKSEDGTSRAA